MRKTSIAIVLAGLLAAIPAQAGSCAVHIDAAASDRYQNKAACGKDALSVRQGALTLSPGGFVELMETSSGARLRCDGAADHPLVLSMREGKAWPDRVSTPGCQWQADKLVCAAVPVCTVEAVQAVQQHVAVYATVQLRTTGEAGRVDTARIRDWLMARGGLFDHCRLRTAGVLPLELNLRLTRDGALSADSTGATGQAAAAACLNQHLAPQHAPAGLSDDYTVRWRLEAP